MHESETASDLRALRNVRRRLTVAFLAIEHLCRKVVAFPPAQRLCSFATDALSEIKAEVVGLEERALRRERQARQRPHEFPEHSINL